MLLGSATHLACTRQFDDVVHVIFQPPEEGQGGARAMLDDGLIERFPSEAIFGMLNRQRLAVGRSAVRAGSMMAGGANGTVDFRENRAPTVNDAALPLGAAFFVRAVETKLAVA